jgi:asparagine synthase (glutamine-hydrolysing)
MCGIVGAVSAKGVAPGRLEAMSDVLTHRGPDGFGYVLFSSEEGVRSWINRPMPTEGSGLDLVGFGHRRLSIIDLSEENAQPMMDSSGRHCVVHNGEIYNYVELREELEQLGYVFRTEGDTEVLLNAYAAWGPDCVNRFNGMWAFALLDVEKRLVFFSRDRFGIKPLYYSASPDGAFLFASEIKGLLAGADAPSAPDLEVLADFLVRGRRPGAERSFFEGIRQLLPAHSGVLLLDRLDEGLKTSRYWQLPEERERCTKSHAVERFRDLLVDAVRVHARSDVPVGTCLSGGLDSSSIVCIAEQLRKENRIPRYAHTAIGYVAPEGEFCERQYMDEVARATSTRMHYVEVDQESFERNLDRIVACQDEPFGSASIAVQWYVFERAQEEGLKVMLDGQGADEALGGYLYYFTMMGTHLLSRGNIPAAALLGLRYLIRYGTLPLPPNALSLRRYAALLPRPLAKLLRTAVRASRGHSVVEALPSPVTPQLQELAGVGDRRSLPDLDEALRGQFERDSLPGLLRFEDRNSMTHSIEARVPFLDYRLVEHAFRLPLDLVIHGATTKYVLREAMKGILPETVRSRKDKIGFRASPGLTTRLLEVRKDLLLSNETEVEKDWFNTNGIEALLRLVGRQPSLEFVLWKLLNTKMWARTHWG